MAETYDTTRFGELYYASQNPETDNLGLAGAYLGRLFEQYNIQMAFLGGWAVFLRGSGRATNDVDITVRSHMEPLMNILRAQPRLCVPAQYGQTSVQIFVHTGGAYDPNSGVGSEVAVSVDIIINGNLNTPAPLPDGTELITPVVTTQGTQPVRVIDVFHQFITKLSAFYTRRSTNDFIDLRFLIQTHYQRIHGFRHYLNTQHCECFVNALASFLGGNPNAAAQTQYYRSLLGLEG